MSIEHNNWISFPESRGIVAGGEGEFAHGGPGQRLQLWQEVLQTNKNYLMVVLLI